MFMERNRFAYINYDFFNNNLLHFNLKKFYKFNAMDEFIVKKELKLFLIVKYHLK